MSRSARRALVPASVALTILFSLPAADAQQKPKAYRIPPVDLKQQIIWGATCDGPNNTGLAFGGQDQKSEDGVGHTRIKVNGEWKDIYEELQKKNPLQKYSEECRLLARREKDAVSKLRARYFKGPLGKEKQKINADVKELVVLLRRDVALLSRNLKTLDALNDYEKSRVKQALESLGGLEAVNDGTEALLEREVREENSLDHLRDLVFDRESKLEYLEKLADIMACEPPPRALSPIVYDAKTKLYFLFGGIILTTS